MEAQFSQCQRRFFTQQLTGEPKPEGSPVRLREALRRPMYLQKEGCVETTLDPGCVPPERVT